ncbi:MAG: tripartite tricarboxylate transporter TctB family protein [Pyramidobacter sp.]|nr:tripartite tricarboxylate transporter TctB family protein [Pyramidobacter sp.]
MSYFMKHLLFSIFSFAFALFFYVETNSMVASARLFPQIVAGLVFVLSIVMAFNAWRAAPPEASGTKINVKRLVTYALMLAVYIFTTETVGYFITTPIFMIVSYLYLKAAGLVKAVLITAAFMVFVYLLFVQFLNLPVPLGLLEPLILGA